MTKVADGYSKLTTEVICLLFLIVDKIFYVNTSKILLHASTCI